MSGSKSSDAVADGRGRPGASDEPLGLTVHAMPTMREAMAEPSRRTASGRWKMIAVMLVCAAPVVASYFTYYVIRPQSRHSFGELIEPQRELPDVRVTDLDGRPSSLRELKGQWLLLSVAGGACDKACQDTLYLQRQLREGLGREKERVDWVWLVSDDAPVPDALRPALRAATVLRVPQATLSQWLAAAPGQTLASHIYLVDPLGHWMMRFPPHLDRSGAAQAKRDLERLLRASASWDREGR